MASSRKKWILITMKGQSNLPCFRTNYNLAPTHLQWVIPWCFIWTGTQFDQLRAWVNCNPFDLSPSSVPNNFWIELSLWYQLHVHTWRNIYFVKVSWWATSLYQDGSLDWNINSTGEMYEQNRDHVSNARAWLLSNNIPYFYDFDYTSQWEWDAENSTKSAVYLANRRAIASQVRTDTGNHQLIDIYIRIHPDVFNSGIFPDTMSVYADQTTMSTDPKTIMIESDHLSLYLPESIHFDTAWILQHSDDVFNIMRQYY